MEAFPLRKGLVRLGIEVCRHAGAMADSASVGQPPPDCALPRARTAPTRPPTASPVTRARCARLRSRSSAMAAAKGKA